MIPATDGWLEFQYVVYGTPQNPWRLKVPADLQPREGLLAFHTQETAMLENLDRKMLLAELEGVLSKLKDQGIEPGLTDEEIQNLDIKNLREVIRRFEKLARTPGGR